MIDIYDHVAVRKLLDKAQVSAAAMRRLAELKADINAMLADLDDGEAKEQLLAFKAVVDSDAYKRRFVRCPSATRSVVSDGTEPAGASASDVCSAVLAVGR
jgi:hypothetical protein